MIRGQQRELQINPRTPAAKIHPATGINMGGWFSSEPEVEAKEAITQTGNAAVQFNWAIFSTGISSLAIILVLIILLVICYRKNQRSNRRARRAELHDIVHSLHRSTPGPEPIRMGYPQYPPPWPITYRHHQQQSQWLPTQLPLQPPQRPGQSLTQQQLASKQMHQACRGSIPASEGKPASKYQETQCCVLNKTYNQDE